MKKFLEAMARWLGKRDERAVLREEAERLALQYGCQAEHAYALAAMYAERAKRLAPVHAQQPLPTIDSGPFPPLEPTAQAASASALAMGAAALRRMRAGALS